MLRDELQRFFRSTGGGTGEGFFGGKSAARTSKVHVTKLADSRSETRREFRCFGVSIFWEFCPGEQARKSL